MYYYTNPYSADRYTISNEAGWQKRLLYKEYLYRGFALDKIMLNQDRLNWSNDLANAFEKVKEECNVEPVEENND